MLIYWESKDDSVFSTTESYEWVIEAASPSSLSGPGPPSRLSSLSQALQRDSNWRDGNYANTSHSND